LTNEKIDLIENSLKSKEIREYEIYLVEKNIYETHFLKNKIDNEREINDLEYVLRILSHKENETGIGILRGNSIDSKDIKKNIDTCLILSKNNTSSKYKFPEKKTIPKINNADKDLLKDPIGIKKDICEEIKSEIEEYKEISPTFGRFRIHIVNTFLRNSNGLDLNALKTFFYYEFALKAQDNGNLSESWETEYIKERSHLNFEKRVDKWVKIAKDTLKAKIPNSNNQAIVVFPPYVLKDAIIPIIGFHALGKSYHEKVSSFKINEKAASDNFTIIDNGLLEGGLMTNSWDGEGNPHQVNTFINCGIFKKRLFDQKYALLGDTISTGNGMRTADGSIINGVSNLQIISGEISIDEIISNINEGYYIEKCSWLNPDSFSGSFGTEIRNGYYIKNGKFQYPIKGGNLSGNVLEMIRDCQDISKESEFSLNSFFPYITFTNLTISS